MANLTIIVLLLTGLLTACGIGAEPVGPGEEVSEIPAAVSEETKGDAPEDPAAVSEETKGDISEDPAAVSEETKGDAPGVPATVPEGTEEISEVMPDVGEEQKLLREVRESGRSSPTPRIIKYIYDEQGYLTAEEHYGIHEQLTSRWEYAYDEQGKIISELQYRDDDVLRTRTEYVYDEQGLVAEKWDHDEKTGDVWREVFTYDDFHNNTSRKRYNTDGILQSRSAYEYTYDGQGNILTMRMNWPALGDKLYIYDYNDDGRISEEWEYSLMEKAPVLTEMGFEVTDVKTDDNGILLWRYEYDYDEQGNVLQKRRYRSDGELESYLEYVY